MKVMRGTESVKRMQESGYDGFIIFITDDAYLSLSADSQDLDLSKVFFVGKTNRKELMESIKKVLIEIVVMMKANAT